MQIHCPHCGVRDVEEFEFRSVAPLSGASAYERIYLRVNVPSQSVEHWQHLHGCRAWLEIERNPSTGEVQAIRRLGAGP